MLAGYVYENNNSNSDCLPTCDYEIHCYDHIDIVA